MKTDDNSRSETIRNVKTLGKTPGLEESSLSSGVSFRTGNGIYTSGFIPGMGRGRLSAQHWPQPSTTTRTGGTGPIAGTILSQQWNG